MVFLRTRRRIRIQRSRGMTVTVTATSGVGQPSDTTGRAARGGSKLLYVVVLVAIAAVAACSLWWAKWRTYHFAVVQDGVLYRDGNRGLTEFRHAVAKGRIKTIVMLIDDRELSAREKPEFAEEV